MKKILLSGMTVLALNSLAFGANIYVGGGIGYSDYNMGISNIRGGDLDEKDKSYQILVGVELNKYFAIETEYNNFGQSKYSFSSGDSFNIGNTHYNALQDGEMSSEAKTLGLSALLKLPMHKYFVPYIKGGYHEYEYRSKTSTSLGSLSSKSTGGDTHYGAGFESQLSKNIITRVSYDNYSFDREDDLSNIGCALIFKF